MTTIAGVRIHPGFFNQRPKRNEYRVSAEPTFKVKKTVTVKPSNPRAKHAMPLIAVIAAVGAVTTAVAATTVWTVITAIGAVVGAVGAVTGNKNLMKIGAIVGIAGAVGGFAAGAGFFGGATDAGASASAGAGSVDASGVAADGTLTVDGAGLGAAPATNIDANFAPSASDTGMINAPQAAPTPPEPPAPDVAGAQPTAAPADLGATAPTATPPSADVASSMPAATPPTTPTAADQITANAQGQTNYGMDDPTASLKSPDLSQMHGDIGGTFNGNLQTPKVAGMPSEPTSFESLMGMFGKMGSATSDFAKANPMIASSIFSGIAGAADSSQRNLRDAQANSLNTDSDMKKQLMKNQTTVGGPIDWTKTFKPGGMIGRGK